MIKYFKNWNLASTSLTDIFIYQYVMENLQLKYWQLYAGLLRDTWPVYEYSYIELR